MDPTHLLLSTDAEHSSTYPLRALPQELIEAVLSHLSQRDLLRFALSCRWAYFQAIPYLWRDLELVDCWSIHPKESRPQLQSLRCDRDGGDEHDDTPIIKKLYVLATNPFVASHVQTVLHRCHLPPPGLFNDLPCMSFLSLNISNDPRTLRLLDLAIWNMKNVNTLRIVFGHARITHSLLNGFLNLERPRDTSLKKLWLENCSLVEPFTPDGFNILHPYPSSGFTLSTRHNSPEDAAILVSRFPGITELESVRIRRLSIQAVGMQTPTSRVQLARGGNSVKSFNDGAGSSYQTTTYDKDDPELQLQKAAEWDNMIYARLPEISNNLSNNLTRRSEHMIGRSDATMFTSFLLSSSKSTLVSLNLDWVIWTDDPLARLANASVAESLLGTLSQLHFPNLRAFQMRNAVTDQTKLPKDLYLFGVEEGDTDGPAEPMFLKFLEAHPSLKCLAWPMDRFFHHTHQSTVCAEFAMRIDMVINNMGRTLIDLRVDADFGGLVEETSDDEMSTRDKQQTMTRRRLFISNFAAHMTKIESLKMEGSIPREEQRETIRALYKCALQKIVLIGVACPIGNTWGVQGEDLALIPDGFQFEPNSHRLLEDDSDTVLDPAQRLEAPGSNFKFEPDYGSGPWPPMMHIIAAYHGASITELKFCGYAGAPITYTPLPITKVYLSALQYFENLRQLVLSMSLPTYFIDHYCDEDIIAYWLNSREPTSTALAVIPPETFDVDSLAAEMDEMSISGALDVHVHAQSAPVDEQNSWARLLAKRYEPRKIAEEVAAQVAPHLSETAKARPRGVNVRAGFCMGWINSDVFNLDVKVGAGDRIIGFEGPREEAERQQWWNKMNSRRWF